MLLWFTVGLFLTVIKYEVDSLELRRIRFDLIYVYKLLFDMVDADLVTCACGRVSSVATYGAVLQFFACLTVTVAVKLLLDLLAR